MSHNTLGDVAALLEQHGATLRIICGSYLGQPIYTVSIQTNSGGIAYSRDSLEEALAAVVAGVERYTRPDGVVEWTGAQS